MSEKTLVSEGEQPAASLLGYAGYECHLTWLKLTYINAHSLEQVCSVFTLKIYF